MKQAQAIYDLVAADFARVNALIGSQLSSDVPLVEKIAQYIVDGGGKRMRPLLVLLVTGALDKADTRSVKLATVIEFLHTATLLHDDVVDTSDLRRGRATANARWGNAPSVLVGDFLYSRAFQLMVQLDSMPIMQILSSATAIIAQGEVLQLMNCKNPDLDETSYMTVIHNKTAKLFEAAAESAAVLCGCVATERDKMRDFGRHLGMAFQLVDDVLDYQGNAADMGKNVGDDLAEGKTTLPLIYAMANSDPASRNVIRNAIRQGGLADLDKVLQIVQTSGALDYTLAKARAQVVAAHQSLDLLLESPYRQALAALADLAINRNH